MYYNKSSIVLINRFFYIEIVKTIMSKKTLGFLKYLRMSSFNASLEEDDEKIEASEAFFCSYLNINTITFVKKRSIDSM